MPHSAAVPPSRPTRRRAGAVKMQPPTGGTILTAPSTGTSLKSEGRRHHTHIQLKINNHTYTGNLTTSPNAPNSVYLPLIVPTSTAPPCQRGSPGGCYRNPPQSSDLTKPSSSNPP
jgi:hypothetical protein